MNSHSTLKEEGFKEQLEIHKKSKFTPAQLEIVRSFYDYGWYNAYGLQTSEKNHKQMMEMLKEAMDKIKDNK